MRDICPVPVTGLAEASFHMAATHGRYAVVTGGNRWKPMLERLAVSLNQQDYLAGIHTVAPSGADLSADPAGALVLLVQACREAQTTFKARAIILGGAGLAGVAEKVQPHIDIPVLDSVQAGISAALQAGARPNHLKPSMSTLQLEGVSPELKALFSAQTTAFGNQSKA